MRHSGDERLHGRGPTRAAKGIVAVMPRQQSFLYSEEHCGRRLFEGKPQARPEQLMIEEINQNPTKISAHETFSRSISELDRSLTRSRRTTIAEIVTVLAALAAPFLLGKIIS